MALWRGGGLDGDFPKQAGKGVDAGRGGMQRRPWRSIPKIAVHGNFTLGCGQPVKENPHPNQCPAIEPYRLPLPLVFSGIMLRKVFSVIRKNLGLYSTMQNLNRAAIKHIVKDY